MDEETVRRIIREELIDFLKSDRYTFIKNIQILDGRNIQLATGTGTKIGTAIGQKIGFWGVAPVDQPATVSDPTAAGVTYSQTQVQSIVDAVKAIIDRLQETGAIA